MIKTKVAEAKRKMPATLIQPRRSNFHVDLEVKSESDEELARQTQAGSLEAFEKLVSRYEQRIFAFAMQWRGIQRKPAK